MGSPLPVRKLIAEEIFALRPDFDPVEGHAPYTWRRTRRIAGETFYDIVGIGSSRKWSRFDVDLTTGLFPTTTCSLYRHDIRQHVGLAALCGRIVVSDTGARYWVHDGSEASAREALQRISVDLAGVGQPWFDMRTGALLDHPLVLPGLDWVRHHPVRRVEDAPRGHSRRGWWQGNLYEAEGRDELNRFLRVLAYELGLAPAVKKQIRTLTSDLLDFATEVESISAS